MRTREQIRKKVLKIPIGDIIAELKDGLETANQHGDICAIVRFANEVNNLEDIVSMLIDIDEETDGLITEG